MANMIDVNSLWNCETCYHHKNGKCDTWCESSESYRPAYSKLKVVEAVEVVHGEWELAGEQLHIEKVYICTACRNYEAWGEFEKTPYCPWCGAKMDGKKVE